MMNFKSTLWALAFACVAVSCSDDVEDGLDNNEGNELNGPTTYMKVTISSTPTTKATGGEEGDEPNGEIGDVSEYKVNDVTVILFSNSDGTEPNTFDGSSKLVAAGYKDGIAQMETSSEIWHSRTTATVTITVTDPKQANSFDGKTYGIIAVTNLGGREVLCDRIKEDDIYVGSELANFLQKEAWNSTNGFVMSTHNDKYNSGGSVSIFDKVTLKAGTNATNAPTASVHVERLAAKIRINEADDITDFIYTVNKGEETEAKVRLDQVAIVNKLTSGTYLLKRVTSQLTDGYSDLPAEVTNDLLLGNESAGDEGIALNYVIDPWTRVKETITPASDNLDQRDALVGASLTSPSVTAKLSYDNDFYEASYTEMWTSFGEDKVDLSSNIDATFPLHLAYTQENTTSLKMQKNGYSTGALFKATYFPKKWAVTKTIVSGTTIGKVEADDIDYNGDEEGTGYGDIGSSTVVPTDFKFYVYEGNVYKDYEAIFNEFVWTQQEPLDGQAGVTIYSYTDFTDTNIENIKVADFFNHLLAEFSDPFDYIDSLKKTYDTNGDGKYDTNDTDYNADKTFMAADAIDTYLSADANKATINAVVLPYEGGVCYYPYWIRHASNNIPTKMSVMEFAIVRNNIYDMTVTGISGLGLSGAEKPDPSKDDEEDKYYFNVEIYVKNWVVRSNSGIIL
ncbi:fimbria major subunit [Parabacteroides sp. AD58]|uniref:Fimbria major subunit n=1 Tax=Parabacteroides absconsus TaxID=2951805 RepID=A0ABZ2IKE5_9BACT|nr:fimbria major subunit [Parabacteroides sp. AD58]MCM6903601.1 fimbria major subunit [Parabacteroides sp. AD58]